MFSERTFHVPHVKSKSKWSQPKSHSVIEVFKAKQKMSCLRSHIKNRSILTLNSEEWKAMRLLKDDKQIVIQKADEGSCVVVQDREYYLFQAERQLKDESIYKPFTFNENLTEDLTDCSNKIFKDLTKWSHWSEKQLNH